MEIIKHQHPKWEYIKLVMTWTPGEDNNDMKESGREKTTREDYTGTLHGKLQNIRESLYDSYWRASRFY